MISFSFTENCTPYVDKYILYEKKDDITNVRENLPQTKVYRPCRHVEVLNSSPDTVERTRQYSFRSPQNY